MNRDNKPALRVMQICGAPDAGGAQAFFLRLTRALHRHKQLEVMPVVRSGSWLAERLREEDIPHHTLGFGGRLDVLTKPRLARLMRQFRPHVAQGWMNRASRFMPRGLCCTMGRLGGYYDLKYYAGLDHLIGNTPDICRYLREKGWPQERVHYLPNFVDLPPDGFKQQAEDVRRRYGISDDATVLLVAARLHPVKGIDVLLNALPHLPEQVHALIAGAGDEEQPLRALAAQLGVAEQVHFAGWVNNITPLCAAADIFVVPSRSEPLGNVVLEAWAHAMPLVSSAAEGPSQLVTPHQDGLLVPIDDASALAEAIGQVIASPTLASTLAEGGLDTLHMHFSEEAVVERYLALYRHAHALYCGGGGGSGRGGSGDMGNGSGESNHGESHGGGSGHGESYGRGSDRGGSDHGGSRGVRSDRGGSGHGQSHGGRSHGGGDASCAA